MKQKRAISQIHVKHSMLYSREDQRITRDSMTLLWMTLSSMDSIELYAGPLYITWNEKGINSNHTTHSIHISTQMHADQQILLSFSLPIQNPRTILKRNTQWMETESRSSGMISEQIESKQTHQ